MKERPFQSLIHDLHELSRASKLQPNNTSPKTDNARHQAVVRDRSDGIWRWSAPHHQAALSPVNGEFHEHTTLGLVRSILCAIDDVESRQVAISFVPE